MLDEKGFDLWADGYDKCVDISDENGSYPFVGYKAVLNEIFNRVLRDGSIKILDVGFGTGTLTTKLYENGCEIFGQDFSDEMIKAAKTKMPNARLYKGEFSEGIVNELKATKYDAIIATYSLHHLTDDSKIGFIKSLLRLLENDGRLYIGDVAFKSQKDLNACKNASGDEWDDEEFYFVYDEIKKYFNNVSFDKKSNCAGILEFWN